MMPEPLVSVFSVAYNTEKWVRQTIESVLMQKTDFPFEYVISDDCSTDKTAEIIQEYAEKYPGIIRFHRNEKNLGYVRNSFCGMRLCKGKYIAMCDTDDYWSSPDKLQRQFDFMEQNPHCSLCCTASQNYYEEKDEFAPSHSELPLDDDSVKWFGIDEFYKPFQFFFHSAGLFMRREMLDGFPDWTERTTCADRTCRLLCALKGPIAYINRTMSVYRIRPNSLWSTDRKRLRSFADDYIQAYRYSGRQHYRVARGAINETIYAERLQIRDEIKGKAKIAMLLSNTFYAFQHFRIVNVKDLLRFPYHFLFIADVIDLLRKKR